jgi:hypothetical protein
LGSSCTTHKHDHYLIKLNEKVNTKDNEKISGLIELNCFTKIIMDNSRVMLKIVASLTDDSGGIINDRHIFILQTQWLCLHRVLSGYSGSD